MASLLVAMCGCCSTNPAQTSAQLAAESVNEFKSQLTQFVAVQNNLQVSNAERLKQIDMATLTISGDSNQAYQSWQAADDKEAVLLYSTFSASKSTDLASQTGALIELEAAPTTSPQTVDKQQFDNVVKDLSTIAAGQSPQDAIAAYVEFGQAVYKDYNSDVKTATKGAASSGTAQQSVSQKLQMGTKLGS